MLIESSAQLHLQTSPVPLPKVTRVFCTSSCLVLRKSGLLQRAQGQISVQNPPQQSDWTHFVHFAVLFSMFLDRLLHMREPLPFLI